MRHDPEALAARLGAAWREATAWPVPHVGVGVVVDGRAAGTAGDASAVFELASVSKLLTAYAVLVAVEEGTVALDDPVGQPGCTVRHLLAHAGGYPFEGPEPIARPGTRRGYSNTGYELLGEHLARRAGLPTAAYVAEAVTVPLGMASTDVNGSPAKGYRSSVDDLVRFAAELTAPTLLAPATWAEACRPQFPELAGIVPGVGSFSPCPWGLGPELRGQKHPHWTGTRCSPATYGHFGGAGTFLWVDPVAGVAAVGLTDRVFGPWALDAWPVWSDTVLASVDDRGG